MTAAWILRGMGLLSVHNATDHVGFVVLNHEYGDRYPELGWMLKEDAEGKGYATEAAKVMLQFAKKELGMENVVSHIDPDNVRSMKVAERLGGRRNEALEQGCYVYQYNDVFDE